MHTNLDELVVRRGLVAAETLARARMVQTETGERIDSVLTRLGMVSEQALAGALADATGCRLAEASDFPEQPLAGDVLSPRFLRDRRIVPLREIDGRVEAACADPLDRFAVGALAFALERDVVPVVARASDIEAALERLYARPADDTDHDGGTADDTDIERLKDMASDAPVVRSVNGLIARAVEARASDIHIEPGEDGLHVRFRVDGALRDEDPPPAALRSAFVSRLKVMANLDIAERRLPQDGRLRLAVKGQDIDFRVATSPTIHGESVVLRILDRSHLQLDFRALGFDDVLLPAFLKVLRQPHGIVLVTGPTGSGKTTTLYASLAVLNTPERKILTIEDPIEYRLKGVNQTQVKPQIGLNFAAALRSFLRQDPDIMMVGEVRDLETAQVAIQSALTGHAILSTLHTNTAASAITRLLDMGVEPFLITSTLNAVLAQRLVRRLCAHCREPYRPSADTLAAMGTVADDAVLYHPRGCEACGHTGFSGRIAVLELLVPNEDIIRLALKRAEARDIERAALDAGMRSMTGDGFAKARAGLTTIEEILRVTAEA
jgi:general secretion pathway protein E